MTNTEANVDPAEIKKFNDLASRWWDPTGDFKPLHDLNPLRSSYIAEHVDLKGANVIDIGCGGGILTEALARAGATTSGIDMGEAPLAVARIHAAESGLQINYEQSTAEDKAAQQPKAFDVVCCLEMLEHVPDPASVVQSCADMLKPGGKLFFSTINRNPKSFLFAVVGAEYVLNLLPKGTHEYKKFIRPSELTRWCRDAKLLVEELVGVTYNPLSKDFKLSQSDVSINYMIRASKPSPEAELTRRQS
jgi:2-polyprenyl-6-hydroxyphenyl methylase / 3-demethylubiquinone-9 3-methyltransferase